LSKVDDAPQIGTQRFVNRTPEPAAKKQRLRLQPPSAQVPLPQYAVTVSVAELTPNAVSIIAIPPGLEATAAVRGNFI